MQIYEISDLREYLDSIPRKPTFTLASTLTNEQKQEINKMTKSIIGGAKMYLVKKNPFIAGFAGNIKLVITYKMDAPMAVNVITTGLTSKPILYINPINLIYFAGMCGGDAKGPEKKYFMNNTFDDVASVLLHELFHLLYNHIQTYEYYSKKGYHYPANLATDCQINQEQFIANNEMIKETGITLESLSKLTGLKLEANKPSIYYFEELVKLIQEEKKKRQQQQQNQSQNQQGNGNQNQQGNGSQNQQGDGNQNQQDNGNQNQQGNGSQNQQGNGSQNQQGDGSQNQQGDGSQNQQGDGNQNQQGDGNQNQQGDGDLTEEEKREQFIDNLIRSIENSHRVWYEKPDDVDDQLGENAQVASGEESERAVLDTIKQTVSQGEFTESDLRGLVSSGFIGKLFEGKNTEGKIPIKAVIQKGCGRLKSGIKKTFTRINKHQSNKPVIKRGKKKLYNKNIRIFCDNSGSMSVDDIQFAIDEASAIAKKINANLEIIPFDTELYLKNTSKILKNGKYTYIQTGCGGTSFQPIFDYLKSINARNDKDLAIILTDGYGESHIEDYKFTNVVWILVDQKSNTLSVRNPKGLIGYLSNDKKYKLYKAGLGRS